MKLARHISLVRIVLLPLTLPIWAVATASGWLWEQIDELLP